MTFPSTLDLVGRLEALRVLLARLTAELDQARMQAAALRVENRRLRAENTRLQSRRAHERAVTSLRERSDKRAQLNGVLP
jgi:regulator of replication initiation timing